MKNLTFWSTLSQDLKINVFLDMVMKNTVQGLRMRFVLLNFCKQELYEIFFIVNALLKNLRLSLLKSSLPELLADWFMQSKNLAFIKYCR